MERNFLVRWFWKLKPIKNECQNSPRGPFLKSTPWVPFLYLILRKNKALRLILLQRKWTERAKNSNQNDDMSNHSALFLGCFLRLWLFNAILDEYLPRHPLTLHRNFFSSQVLLFLYLRFVFVSSGGAVPLSCSFSVLATCISELQALSWEMRSVCSCLRVCECSIKTSRCLQRMQGAWMGWKADVKQSGTQKNTQFGWLFMGQSLLPYENIIMRKKIMQISRTTYRETMPGLKWRNRSQRQWLQASLPAYFQLTETISNWKMQFYRSNDPQKPLFINLAHIHLLHAAYDVQPTFQIKLIILNFYFRKDYYQF